MDTVIGAKESKAVLLVLTERYSRYELILKLKNKTQESVINALNLLERKHKHDFQKLFKSITVDNGVEFIDHSSMEKSIYNTNIKKTNIYYSHPYCSFKIGSNENNNKLIRKFIHKKADIGKFSNKSFAEKQIWINNYHRKLFNYKSANDIFLIQCKKHHISCNNF